MRHHSTPDGDTCPGSGDAFDLDSDGDAALEAAFIYAANMTLRDHFAGLAMAAYLGVHHHEDCSVGMVARGNPDKVAAWAYENADAMLAARGEESR